jgi:hypothetical protein
MELVAYLIIGIFFTILFGDLSYKIWLIAFDTIFGTLNKRMIVTSKLLGILWPITLPILIIITFVYLLK